MHLTSNVDGSKLSGEVDGVLVVETEIEVELEGVVGITPSWWADVGALTTKSGRSPANGLRTILSGVSSTRSQLSTSCS